MGWTLLQRHSLEALQRFDELWTLGAALLGLLALVAVGEGLRRVGVRSTTSRYVVHLGVGLFMAATPYVFTGPGPVYVLAGCFVAGNAIARWRRWWPGIHAARPESVGTVAFPLAVFPALLLAWQPDAPYPWAVSLAFLVLAVSDPLAAWAGTTFGQSYSVGRAQKSWAGSLTFAVSAWGVSMVVLAVTDTAHGVTAATISLVVATTSATAEALGGRGWDNLFIVVAAIVPLVMWADAPSHRFSLLVGVAVGAVFAAGTWRMRWLSCSGALAGGLLAASLVAMGWAEWAVPAFVFFVLSSLLSRVGRRRKRATTTQTEKGAVRDAGQVYANGGVGWTLLIAHALIVPEPALYGGFLGAFAAAAADTWATELGTLAPGRPRLITTGRPVPAGTSGAVSGWGTVASLAGATTVGASAWLVAPTFFDTLGGGAGFGVVVGAGVGGALVDSVLGATVQAQYEGGNRRFSERPGNTLVRGRRWMTNDRVNEVGTLAGALIGGIGAFLLDA